jgi:glutamate dehydrogenase
MGATFVSRLVAERGASPADVVRAWRLASEVTFADFRRHSIERLDASVAPQAQAELLMGVQWLVELVTRRYLGTAAETPLPEAVARGREGFERIAALLTSLGTEEWRAAHEARVGGLVEQGVPEHMARGHAFTPALVHAPDAIAVADHCGRPVEDVARAFYLVEDRAELGWLERQVDGLAVSGRMQRWAQQALRDDVLRVRRDLVQAALREDAGARPVEEALDAFFARRDAHSRQLGRFVRALAHDGASSDLAGLSLALRQVRALVEG